MPSSLLLSEQLTYSTVRISAEYSSGTSGVGTGFFYHFARDGDRYVPAIVTNKHVVDGATRFSFSVHLRPQPGVDLPSNYGTFTVNNAPGSWIGHPDDEVDLTVLPITGIVRELESQGNAPFFIAFDEPSVITGSEVSDIGALEDIVMVGYPIGLWDATNNMPVIRKGITASHPRFDWNGRREFLIDAACFPGSSGSPVILYNVGSVQRRSGLTLGDSRIKLLGILYGGPQFTAEGHIDVVDVPTKLTPIAKSRIPMNLGVVIKAERLFELDAVVRLQFKLPPRIPASEP
jgi:trypsin-like peptidase